MINMLTRQLGSAQQAEAQYRASVRGLALNRMELQLKRLGTENQYKDLMDAARVEVETLNDQARQASMSKPTTAKYEYDRPKPVGGAPAPAGAVAGAPAQETFVDTELQRWGQAKNLRPKDVYGLWGKYTKEIAEAAPAYEAIRGAKEAIAPYRQSGDVAGKGVFAKMAPDWWAGTEGNNVHQHLGHPVPFKKSAAPPSQKRSASF
jgi:hypothetical protein